MITYLQLGRHGNTGNSMFQLAALVGTSKATGFDFTVPQNDSYYDIHYQCNNRSVFDGFNINCNILKDEEKGEFKYQYEEPHFHYSSNIKKIKDWTNLSGYYQTEKYFEHCKEDVYNCFAFKDSIKKNIDRKISQKIYPDPELCTSIHVRRGDYVVKQDYHPLQSAEYYKLACKIADNKYYVIFSDDIEWCKQSFGNHDRIFYSQESDPFEAMYHMSLCSNHIICNSSFGWWGAWLGEMAFPKRQHIIVSPKKWFGPGHSSYDTKDIIPERWKRI